jgi:translation initiation factor 2 subunit 1
LDALKDLLNGDETVLEGINIEDNVKTELLNILKERLVSKPVEIKAEFKLTCYTFYGIDSIKEALLDGEKKGTKEFPIKFKIITSPFYECRFETRNKVEGIKVMKSALEEVKKSIESKGGAFMSETKQLITVSGEDKEKKEDGNKEDNDKGEEEDEEKEEEKEEQEEEEEHPEGIEIAEQEGNKGELYQNYNIVQNKRKYDIKL